MIALDLFCGAGGASMGLRRAGFDVVVGVDRRPQPRYPFLFVQADALKAPFDLRSFDFIWASPPCQRFTIALGKRADIRARHPDLIEPTRAMLLASGVPFVIENVPGAPMRPDAVLHGAMFDLDVVRNRVFETHGFRIPFTLSRPHRGTVANGDLATVAGHGVNKGWHLSWSVIPPKLKARLCERNSASGWSKAMGIDWMTRDEMAQAIPPAYGEFIGRAAIAAITSRKAA